MNLKAWIILDVLLAFAGYTLWVVWNHGYADIFLVTIAHPASAQVGIDLVIAVALGLFWMWGDAKQRQITVWPFVLMCLTLGSIGLLSYLLVRELRANKASQGRASLSEA